MKHYRVENPTGDGDVLLEAVRGFLAAPGDVFRAPKRARRDPRPARGE